MTTTARSWTSAAALGDLPRWAVRELDALAVSPVARGTVLFRPGQPAEAFVVILSGRIDVFLTGPSGRDILLYSVSPGQSCVQTTLGLLGGEAYAGEAVAAEPAEIVAIPRGLFLRLMDQAAGFRGFVFGAFAARMQDMLHLLERVAFQKVESRLAAALLALSVRSEVHATQAELASRIGSAREVVSRRLDHFSRSGWVEVERGHVHLRDFAALRRLASAAE